jgi:hypothetical protein
MAIMSKTRLFLARSGCLVALLAIECTMGSARRPQSARLMITLTGQSMIRSDIRATAPSVVPVIRRLLKGDVVFTNLEAAVAETGETVREGRGFLTPPEALDALTTFGFNLLSLSGNNLGEAEAPGYLHTPRGTIALIASAPGLIAPGGSATADRPGVNELHIEAGGTENEATADLPGAPGNIPNQADSQRILQSIRDARQHSS